MVDKWQAQYNFWSGFGVPAYEENSVPDDAQMPYITYSSANAGFGSSTLPAVSIWTRSPSWASADALSDMIQKELGEGGKLVHYGGGALWFFADNPFSQSMGDPNDDLVKRKLLNIVTQFL